MVLTALLARVRNFPVASEAATWGERGQAIRHGFFPLLTPVIMLGGILLGIFTPTEAAAIAVGYALVLVMLGDANAFRKRSHRRIETSQHHLRSYSASRGSRRVVRIRTLALTGTPQRITQAFLEYQRQPTDALVPTQYSAADCRHVSRRRSGNSDIGTHSWTHFYRVGCASLTFCDHHVCECDRLDSQRLPWA